MDIEKKCRDLLVKSLRPLPQELNEVDWKVALSHKKDRLKKHLSAFSNLSGGGFLIFGVNDDGKVVGISDEESRLIADALANMARTGLEPQVNIKYITFNFDGFPLLGIYIEESFEKPVHIKNKSIERAYIRAGGQSRIMSMDEVRRAVVSSRSLRFGEITAAFSHDVLDSWEDYFDFTEVMKRTRPSGFTGKSAFYEYLLSLRLLTKVNNIYVPTNLAVICCAKDFTKLHSYERFSIRLIQYKGNTKLTATRDETVSVGYSLGLDRIINTVTNWLPHSEEIIGASLVTRSTIPEVALREIIVNAIIHRDFTISNSCITVELYDDRIEITNPGSLLPEISVDRLIDHPSRTRNEVLSDLMRKLGFAEERGSGIDKAVIASEKMGLPPIDFRNEADYFRVTLFSARSFQSMSKSEKIDTIYQHACLNSVIQRNTTGRSIRERFRMTRNESTKVYRLIDDSISVGKIKLANPEDSRKDHYYLPYWM
ncbi:MAG: putative DNA binding domain-containing protein [Bacteriovoracaceae bacterium]|nr:putative DNA binding domain-containing protein [Bacteriovoracaceae bacterium]